MNTYVYRLLFIVVCLIGSHTIYRELCGNQIATVDNGDSVLRQFLYKQQKYFDTGTVEYITFYSPCTLQHCNNADIMRTGILVKRPHASGTVLICHGFMCDKFDTGFLRMLFPNFNVMTFDFRAHGENIDDKQLCTFGKDEAADVYAAVNYLRSREDLRLGILPLICFGFSMGAVAAIEAQAEHDHLFDIMILDCPYDNSANVLKRCMENLKFSLFGYEFALPGRSLLEQYAFNPVIQRLVKVLLKTVAHLDATATNTFIYPLSPAESIKKVNVPCLFIHCINDEKVSLEAAKNIFNNAAGYKRLWLTAGRRHFDSFFYNPEKYVYKVNKFISDILDGHTIYKAQAKIKEDSLGQKENSHELTYIDTDYAAMDNPWRLCKNLYP